MKPVFEYLHGLLFIDSPIFRIVELLFAEIISIYIEKSEKRDPSISRNSEKGKLLKHTFENRGKPFRIFRVGIT